MIFNCRSDWNQRFEKLAQIYRSGTERDEDSGDESPNIQSKPSKSPAFMPHSSASVTSKNEARHSPPPPAPSSPISSVIADSCSSNRSKSHPDSSHMPVLVTKSIASESLTFVPQIKSNGNVHASSDHSIEKTNASSHSSSSKPNHPKIDPPSVSSSQMIQAPLSSFLHKQQQNAQTPITSKHKPGSVVTIINNLYTNPAHRSSAVIKPPDVPPVSPGETAVEPVVNGHLINNSSPLQCSAKSVSQLSSSGTNTCDNQKASKSAKSVKGVETWC